MHSFDVDVWLGPPLYLYPQIRLPPLPSDNNRNRPNDFTNLKRAAAAAVHESEALQRIFAAESALFLSPSTFVPLFFQLFVHYTTGYYTYSK